ncbi:MAG: hypothetical protein ACJ8GW_15055 [Massilia sp.]
MDSTAYVAFRLSLARHGLRQFAASLRSSAEIVVLIGGNVVIALLALSAFPTMYAATLTPLLATTVVLTHALIMSLPLALLRKRVLPADVVAWHQRLPVPPTFQLRADATVAALLIGPLAILYTVSGTILLYEHPAWLRPVVGVVLTLVSLAISFAVSNAVLRLRLRRPTAGGMHGASATVAMPYQFRGTRLRLPMLWHRLFWLPYWRLESVVGFQQTALLAAALVCAVVWMHTGAGWLRALLTLACALLMVVVTDRGDKAVREQTDFLRPAMASWPLAPRTLFLCARLFSAAPALLVLLVIALGGAPHGLWQHRAGQVYLVLGCLAPLLLVATPLVNERFRVGLVATEILLLCAVGSELWT